MEKVCTRCGERKPLSEYHRNRGARDGARTECKMCACARRQRFYDEHLRARYDTGPTSGVCAHCGEAFEYVKTTGRRRMYCSERCKYLAGDAQKQARAPRYVRRCECGSTDVARVGKPVCAGCRKDSRSSESNRVRERRRLLRLYNITQSDWDAMVERQGNRCAICPTDRPGGRGESWHIDHDHACCPGKGSCGRCVRGLLCGDCNVAIGRMRDDPVLLRAAASYLERPRQPRLFVVA